MPTPRRPAILGLMRIQTTRILRLALLVSACAAQGCATHCPLEEAPAAEAEAAATVQTAEASPTSTTEHVAPLNITTAEGLVIEDTVVGVGEPCPPGATIVMNFTAMLVDGTPGTVYDSSDKRKRPLEVNLASPGLIRGLREGIPGMRPGGKRTVMIPWKLGYGEQGREPIPPKTDLRFEIELLSFTPPAR